MAPDIVHSIEVSPPPLLCGTAIVPADDCTYLPSVDPADLLRVNFDCRTVTADGLYLLERINGSRVTWRGCRRFARLPTSLRVDQSGHGDWVDAKLSEWGLRVVGHVERVYRLQKVQHG